MKNNINLNHNFCLENRSHKRRLWLIFAAAMNFISIYSSAPVIAENGRFIGKLVMADFDESKGRKFRLIEPFEYVDPNGLRWRAETGTVTDGASIPRALWTIVGSPYTGLYRKAAIIHDFYCDKEHRYWPWEKVHRVFYDAMITAGVSKAQALLMYYAVWRFGPRWKIEEITNCRPGHACFNNYPVRSIVTTARSVIDDTNKNEVIAEIKNFKSRIGIEANNPEDVVAFASQQKPIKTASDITKFDEKSETGRQFLRNLRAR